MAEFNLGQVAFFDKGLFSLSETYTKWDFVTTADSTYLYIGESPAIGKPVTDAAYWKCIADGKQATEAADLANEVATHPPTITNGTWHYWDTTLQTYVDSEIAATAYELYLQTTTDDPPKSESEYALYPITQGDYAKGIGEGLEAAVALKENKANKVTSLSSESTDEEYPSAKVTFDKLTLKIDKTSIANELGDSEELVVSQKGVSDKIKTPVENAEQAAAASLVELKKEVEYLRGILSNVITYLQISTLSVDNLQIKGAPLFIFSDVIPAVVPDFAGQIYIKTTATAAAWIALGDSSVSNWKEV